MNLGQQAGSRRRFLASGLKAGTLFAAAGMHGRAQGRASSEDLAYLSLEKAAGLVRTKEVSPVEIARLCLERIEKLNPVLNAFITVTAETALAEARQAEAEILKGQWRGPLHGIPIALKDLFDTAGVKTTAASGVFANRVPDENAEVVRRLKTAGAVLLGKLNMSEFAYSETSVFSCFGAVHNPWDVDYVAGGSSGGSAAAVAAGLCYGALGSDTGGSIRQPAAYCDIVGLKPTYGRVSTRGVIPLAWSLDHVGPMTRTVADSAILLQVLAGYDPDDIASVDVPVPEYASGLGATASSLRLGVPKATFYEKLDPEIDTLVNAALALLGGMTADVREVTLPVIPDLPILKTEAYAYHASYLANSPELYQPETLRSLRRGAEVDARTYILSRRTMEQLRRSVQRVFSDVDLVITPTTPLPPPTIQDIRNGNRPKGAPGLLRNTTRFDIYGLPSISVPCGFTSKGLPVGLQISGPNWGETQVFALAHIYEHATAWRKRRPKVG